MRLYVMRHGPAEDRAPSGQDFDRVLTVPGREIVRGAARSLQAHRGASLADAPRGASLPRILASPRARARETALLVRGEIARDVEVELRDELGGERSIPLELIDELAAAGRDALLVGHQPVVEELVLALLAPASPSLGGFRTATVVALVTTQGDVGAVRWSLEAVLDPGRRWP